MPNRKQRRAEKRRTRQMWWRAWVEKLRLFARIGYPVRPPPPDRRGPQ